MARVAYIINTTRILTRNIFIDEDSAVRSFGAVRQLEYSKRVTPSSGMSMLFSL